jgi:hypothetical protein
MYGAGSGFPPGFLPDTSGDSLLSVVSLISIVIGVLIVATTIVRLIAKRHYKAL